MGAENKRSNKEGSKRFKEETSQLKDKKTHPANSDADDSTEECDSTSISPQSCSSSDENFSEGKYIKKEEYKRHNNNIINNKSRKRKVTEIKDDKDHEPSNKKRKSDNLEKERVNDNKDDSFGENFYCPTKPPRKGLRPIFIDGSNVAFCHGKNKKFSVRGLEICIKYFKRRGHKVVAFVPNFRLRKGETDNHKLLHKLVHEKSIVITPTLYIKNERRIPYDDWYIVQSAAVHDGIIVSRDNFQDIVDWKESLRETVELRRLVPTFVDDMLIFPVDPHGNRRNDFELLLRY